MPHVPWRVPREFFDLHPIDEVEVPELWPADPSEFVPYARDKIVDRHHSARAIREAGIWREAVQAYLAAGSYADWCVGTVLDALDASPYADSTIVVLWTDHGFHLGEKLHWHKFTLWEEATRVPFLLRVPGRYDSELEVTEPVSMIDLAPTLAELCGVELSEQHSGQSLLSIIEHPELAAQRPPISTWKPGNHAVRRGPWRYIRYENGDTELYDHRVDRDERVNLAKDLGYAHIADELDHFLPTRSAQS
jgi:arylsulfatase A-like enzyme